MKYLRIGLERFDIPGGPDRIYPADRPALIGGLARRQATAGKGEQAGA